jgi:hypothetical protein
MKPADCLRLKDVVFAQDRRIRYFGFMDNRQGMIVSELRNKDQDHPGESQLVRDLTFFKAAMASWSLYFGRVRYAVVSHDMFMIVMIPMEGGLAIITAESTLPLDFVDRLYLAVRQPEQLVSGKL